MRETEILKAIMLELGNEPDLVVWRNQVGSLSDASGRYVRFGLGPGSADIIGVLAPRGRLIALEVKRPEPGSKQSEQQRNWERVVRELGAIYAVVRSPAEARAVVDIARREP